MSRIRRLDQGWTLVLDESGTFTHPSELPDAASCLPAPVPGTVASALEAAGRFDRMRAFPLNTQDAWYRLSLSGEDTGPAILRFEGLATLADIWLNGELLLSTGSMFERYDVPVDLTGKDELAIRFRALAPHFETAGPRARWRPQMINARGLRLLRTTLLGYMPGWCPEIHAAGPWRPVLLLDHEAARLADTRVSSHLTPDGVGVLRVTIAAGDSAQEMALLCDGLECAFTVEGDHLVAELHLPDVEPWWPHTHGNPRLHDVSIRIGGIDYPVGRTGFRHIEVYKGTDGKDFAILVNGQRIFCRGAVWTSADIVRLAGESSDYEPWLRLAAAAGMNMIRIGGTMAWETPEFFRLCDALGIMIWQDVMLANFDYPVRDTAFMRHIEREVSQFLDRTGISPSLTVLCGGSEVYQQGAMLGLPETTWKGPLFTDILPCLAERLRPDVIYVENSPSGGALPFFPGEGVAHYYGVGAYCRPLDDARRANVRFAAECLAFANVPQQAILDTYLPVPAVHDPRWKAQVPRDRGASWDFEDVRDHYLGTLHDCDPARLRREQPLLYLELSRAVTGEVIEATFAEWRRCESSCNGALIWTLQDLLPGPGWGLIDATGTPKPAWYAARRAFRPVQIMFSDEGTNGLDIHVINETASVRDVVVEFACLRDGTVAVVSGRRALSLGPRQSVKIAATDLIGAFFDTTWAYRFGPPAHDVTVATLVDGMTGEVIADTFHFPQGRAKAIGDARLEASLHRQQDEWWLEVTTDRFAMSVHAEIGGYRVEDDYFHLPPGRKKRLKLLALSAEAATPSGTLGSAGSKRLVSVG